MNIYIKPKADLIRLNLSEQLLDFEIAGYSKGTKKSDAWAKNHSSFDNEDWDDGNDNCNGSQAHVGKNVWDD